IDGISVYGYTNFTFNRAFAEKFDSADIFDSIVFVYDTIVDTVRNSVIADSGVNFRLFSCTDENKYTIPQPAADDDAAGVLKKISDDDPRFAATLLDAVLSDSIFKSCTTYKRCIIDADDDAEKQHCDSTFNAHFFISLFSGDTGLTWFKFAPAMVIHSHRMKEIDGKDSMVARTDSLRGLSGIVAHEADSLIASLSPLPLSTWLSQRTAVFKIDLARLWETMSSTGFNELLSAAIVFEHRQFIADGNDTTPTLFYFLSDQLYSKVGDFDNEIDSINKYYSPVIKLKSPDSDTLVLPVDYHLQHYVKSRQQYFYLYLRITSADVYGKQEILWGAPRFKAVLTTIK
ncbi:MAG: hypothetical protein JXA18_06765, partial [Chitinispirillaceae bacterium]|nr:hypothetical protein [Chitinispirillaceae bacterium]